MSKSGLSPQDRRFLDHAFALGRRHQGRTGANPSVGCVIADGTRIIGRAVTALGGRPHAESQALAQAGAQARGTTAYVTLEPCAHEGGTPACARLLTEAGIARIVVGTKDPDHRTSGSGMAMLTAAGVRVDFADIDAAHEKGLRGFLKRQTEGRPYIVAKVATSLDGAVALANGQSQWITGAAARRHGHLLRAQADMLISGSGTVLADSPRFDCRLSGLEAASPAVTIIDRRKRLQGFQTPTHWQLAQVPQQTLGELLYELAREGIGSVLLEAGGTLLGAFLSAGLIDEIAWFRGPSVLGGDSRSAFSGFKLNDLAKVPAFERVNRVSLGSDYLETWRRTG